MSTTSEWRDHWKILLASFFGFSTSGIVTYGFSAFVPSIEHAFGWGRAEVMAGYSISLFASLFLNVFMGMAIDRFGSRRIGLAGIVLVCSAIAALGTATGTHANWLMLWIFVALGSMFAQPSIWSRVIANNFDRTRGKALAVGLTGTTFATMVAPALATALIAHYGWRWAFAGVAAIWLGVTFPLVFLFFREGPSRRGAGGGDGIAPALEGMSLREGLLTATFAKLFISFGCFSYCSITIATNLVPLLNEKGIPAMAAAGYASIMGIFGVIGRLSIGVLLDRFPANLIGAGNLLLPIVGCGLLLIGGSDSLLTGAAVATFGFVIGAELDVAIYVTTRTFGMRSYASIFSVVLSAGSIMAAIGPVLSGWLHDQSGNYDQPLRIMMLMLAIASLAMATIRLSSPAGALSKASPDAA